MRIPVLPVLLSCVILVGAFFLVNSSTTSRNLTMGPPDIERLADLDGIETEVAIAPDGTRLIAVASGDLWLLDTTDGSRQQLTNTPDIESSPAWAPDGSRVSFTRNGNSFAAPPADIANAAVLKENATSLNWSPTGRMAFVRDRALWLTDAAGQADRQIVPAGASAEITFSEPRFSPDSRQIAFLKRTRNLQGEVWVADAASGEARPLIADRAGENPVDVGWFEDGNKLVYLTNRSGGYAVWVFDIAQNLLTPLTMPLGGVLWQHTGMAVHGERIILARQIVDSDIVLSDGTVLAATDALEFQPAVSPNERLIAYTVQKGNNFEVWTAGMDGTNPTFRALGAEPRFSANDYQLVYTHTDVQGRVDLRRLDIRDGRSASVTDAPEVDFQPDWSPDGRIIVFASAVGGRMGLWQVPATGGKRLPVHSSGYYPRFSPDGESVVFWDDSALWLISPNGGTAKKLRDDVPRPVPAAWVKGEPRHFGDPEVYGGKPIWPQFDVMSDGRLVLAPIEVQETSLWSISLTYTED